jgi:hypothetical protein
MTCRSLISSGSYGAPYQSSAACASYLFAGDIVREFIIARKTAAIFRRAAPLPTEELRIERSSFGNLQFFDSDPVLPVVARVLDVADLSYANGQRRR